jgi:hypothetical protein
MKHFVADNSVQSTSGRPRKCGVVVKSRPRLVAPALVAAALLWSAEPASAQAFSQWLSKLVGSNSVGFSAALSGDGSTVLIGGFGVDYVFRHGGPLFWTLQQQGGGGRRAASSNGSNGIHAQAMAESELGVLSTQCLIAASPTNKPSPAKLPHGSNIATCITPKPTGNSQLQTPALSSKGRTLSLNDSGHYN